MDKPSTSIVLEDFLVYILTLLSSTLQVPKTELVDLRTSIGKGLYTFLHPTSPNPLKPKQIEQTLDGTKTKYSDLKSLEDTGNWLDWSPRTHNLKTRTWNS